MRRALRHLVPAALASFASTAFAAADPSPAPPPKPVSSCTADVAERERLLALGVARFDRSSEGWRPYGDALSELARVLALDERRPTPDPGWRWYVTGSMAFLRQDRPGLDLAAQSLDAYAKGESGSVQAGDRLNLNALHGFQRCLGRGYAFAYSSPDCRDLDEARRLNDAIG